MLIHLKCLEWCVLHSKYPVIHSFFFLLHSHHFPSTCLSPLVSLLPKSQPHHNIFLCALDFNDFICHAGSPVSASSHFKHSTHLSLICNRYTHVFANLICSPWILIPVTLIIIIAFLSFSVAIWALPHSISETASIFSICHIIIFSTREATVVLSLPIASTSISLIRVWPPGLLGALFAFKHKKRELSQRICISR